MCCMYVWEVDIRGVILEVTLAANCLNVCIHTTHCICIKHTQYYTSQLYEPTRNTQCQPSPPRQHR